MIVNGINIDIGEIYRKNGSAKVKTIKEIRELTGAGLREAKDSLDKYEKYGDFDISDDNIIYLINCPCCGNKVSNHADSCPKCGHPINKSNNENSKHTFNGVYRYKLFGDKEEVYCPRCNSEDCSHYTETHITPAKTKTKYTANLNPFKPFTLVNKKEKIVKKEKVRKEDMFVCNKCGNKFR